jgi:hypothetical protein
MIDKILEIAFSGFWKFWGVIILLVLPVSLILNLWSRFMRMIMVRKHGWPPSHLDADGDWPKKDEDK